MLCIKEAIDSSVRFHDVRFHIMIAPLENHLMYQVVSYFKILHSNHSLSNFHIEFAGRRSVLSGLRLKSWPQ